MITLAYELLAPYATKFECQMITESDDQDISTLVKGLGEMSLEVDPAVFNGTLTLRKRNLVVPDMKKLIERRAYIQELYLSGALHKDHVPTATFAILIIDLVLRQQGKIDPEGEQQTRLQ
jgi:hypothetical protein